jgi:type I restriction enzyme S subunit
MELKQGYKQTDLGLIPIDWEVKTLGEIAVIRDGTHQTPTYVDYGVPFYSVESVTNNNFTNTKFITEEAHKILTKTFKIEKGDILMTRIGSIGDCKLIDWDVNASFYVSLALLKIKSNYLASYISHYSKSASFQKETEINSLQSAIPRKINLGPISNIRVLIPTNAEQTAIATALSNIDDFIAQTEKLIEKKKAIKQGVMQELLKPKEGWMTKKLGEVINKVTTGKLDANAMKHDGDYRFYTCAREYYFIDHFAFDDEVLLISGNGANVGYIHYYKGKFNAYQRTYVLTGFKVNVWFVKIFLDKYLSERIATEVSAGSTPYIKMDTITDMEIQFPASDSEQDSISNSINEITEEINLIENKLRKIKLQKQGMMQALLTGKIRLI